ncbi:hypothetical protein JCM8547_008233 [Rhodosporidiobolus lusitaniae]
MTTRRSAGAPPSSAGGGGPVASGAGNQTTPSTSHTFYPSPLDAILAKQGLERYHIAPPSWRAPWITDARSPAPGAPGGGLGLRASVGRAGATGLGAAGGAVGAVQAGAGGSVKAWPVFYPPRDGMDEDQMTEHAVKAGYVSKALVQAENFSAHQHIYDKLKTNDILGNLSRLVGAVQAKAQASLPSYGNSSFRLPSRITLTDSKREAWFSDLASPSIPLSKLSRSVPHGYKGEKGLDMLAHRKVDVSRAVWFVRAFGGVEIQSLAKTRKPSLAISHYTTEFTSVVCDFIRKQLAEVVLPASVGTISTPVGTPAATPGTSSATASAVGRARSGSTASNAATKAAAAAAAATAGAGLMDDEKRRAWEGKYEYTVRLVSSLYEEALLDRPQFLRFLVTLLDPASSPPSSGTTTIGQLPFVLLLVEEHLNDILAFETTTARLVRGCLLRLQELDGAPPSAFKQSLIASFTSLVRSAFLATPDAFIPLLPKPIYPLSSSSTTTPKPGGNDDANRLAELYLRSSGNVEERGKQEDPILRQTIQGDLEELKLRRAFPSVALAAQTAAIAPAEKGGAGESASDRTLLAAIAKLDKIEFPVKMRDVHQALFVGPPPVSSSTPSTASAPTPAAAPAPSPASHRMANSSSASSSHPSSSSRNRTSITSTHPTAPRQSSASSSSFPPALPISLSAALPLLYTWATTPTRPSGPHRPYAVARLISLELERLGSPSSSSLSSSSGSGGGKAHRSSARLSAKRTSGGGRASTGVEDVFVRWVDEQFPPSSPPSGPSSSSSSSSTLTLSPLAGAGKIAREDVRLLATELIRSGVLNYGTYLQRMIARGETEQREENADGEPSLHLWMLRTVPLAAEPASVPGGGAGGARRVAVGGTRGVEQVLKTEARIALVRSELGRLAFSAFPGAIEEGEGAGRLLQAVRRLAEHGLHWTITRDVLLEGLSARIDATTGKVMLEKEELAVVVAVYEAAQDWWGMLQLLVVLLGRSPFPPLVDHVLDVVETRLSTWTALDGLSELGNALYTVYQSYKSSPTAAFPSTSRRLLTLLDSFSSSGLLPSKVKAIVESDVSEHSHSAPTPRARQRNPLLSPIAELQSLLIDSSPAAIEQVASFVLAHYSSYGNWTTVALDGLVQLLPQLESVEPALDLLRALREKGAIGLDEVPGRWVAVMTPAQLVSTFGGVSSPLLATFLGRLVEDGLVPATAMVKDVILPAWRTVLGQYTAAVAELHPTQLDPVAIQSMQAFKAVLSALLVPSSAHSALGLNVDGATPSFSDLSPAVLAERQRHASRRSSLLTHSNLPILSQLLALLLIQQEITLSASQSDLAESTGALLLQFSALPELQSLVVRDPMVLRDGMLEGAAVKALPRDEHFRPMLLAGVLSALENGGAATPVNLASTEDWDVFLSGLTLWRLAVSKVEIEACLERLELDTALSSSERTEALSTLSKHLVNRVCSGEGQSYLGQQVVKCYHGSASNELISVAFSRLAAAFDPLSRPGPSDDDRARAFTTIRCASRLLDTVLRFERASSRSSSVDELLNAIKLLLVQDRLNSGKMEVLVDPETQQGVLHAAHLLSVALSCTTKPAEKQTVELYRDCLAACAKLATVFAKGRAHDCELSVVLLDTCSQILYALPDLSPTSRPPTLQTLLLPPAPASSSSTPLQPLSLDLVPDSTFSRLTRLFGPPAPSTLVPNPWELLDHTDPSSTAATALIRRANPPSAPQLTNAGPIDLAAFRAKVVETIPAVTALDALSSVSSASASTSATGTTFTFEKGLQTNFDFETACTTLTVTAKDHRRTLAATRILSARLEAGGSAAAQAQAQAAAAAAQAQAGRKRNAQGESVKPSPTASAGAPTPVAAAPAAAASAAAGGPPVSGRGAKRKASTQGEVIVLDDDEDDGGRWRTGGKLPAAPPAKKKTKGAMAGKAPAKTVASKTTKKKR